ncbi:hypothetical protein V0288_12070 [Pannus brasiliensis CCIBt3594]|uniref:Uncharacterized protein n=1 Tax=Pannus brasiliensis CCIBt3594 TaxID=1427578 RepID=A0AAW9QS38_9CHRO
MTIYLDHFDTKLRLDLGVKEPLKNCLAEYLFPSARFSIGEISPDSVAVKDLRPYRGRSLQFASGKRMYFSDHRARDLLYPNPSDGAAYGSLPFTPCLSFHALEKIRVLVIDDTTGDSNGILPKEQARRLVGDCYGKMSPNLAERLTGKTDTPFQFRLGIRPQEGCAVYRIAKGTLAPDFRLETLTGTIVRTENRIKAGYDLILPTSSFKGRKGADAIKLGEYLLDLGIGVKALAEYGRQSLGAQVLVNYPKGVDADVLPILREKAEELASAQADVRALSRYFVRTYEERKARLEEENSEDLAVLSPLDALAGEETADTRSREQLFYELLKTDLEHHGQLLEHPYVIDELRRFVQRQWMDIATGRAIVFQSALAQPSLDLKENEVCVPRIPDGVELIVTRSPLVNSNGVITLTNRHLPHLMKLEGSIHIHPETAAKHLQADFDGDRLAFERADKYPALTAEIKESLLPENRYPDVIKRAKVLYQGSFESITVSAVENDIGKIANRIMMAVTLRWETLSLPEEKKPGYVKDVAEYYRGLLARSADPEKEFSIPDRYRADIEAIAGLPEEPSPQEIETALQRMRDIQFRIVGDLSNELQVAVDGPKSALRPDKTILSVCKEIGGYVPVLWLAGRDKSRNPSVYRTHPLITGNHGPIDRTITVANEKWTESHLVARSPVEFRNLFPEPAGRVFSDIAGEIKEAYNDYLKAARSLEDLKTQNPELSEPYIEVTSATSGKTLYLTRLDRFGVLESELRGRDWSFPLDLRLEKNNFDREIPNSLIAIATLEENGEFVEKAIGAIAISDLKRHDLKAGIKLTGGTAAIRPGITHERIEGIYKALDEYVEMVRSQHPPGERSELAAALWQGAHTRDDYGTKKALLAFKLFPDEVIERLKQLQFTELKVVGLHFPTNEYGNRQWRGEEVDCEIALHPLPDKTGQIEEKRVIKVGGKVLAPLTSESSSLPVGTKFRGAIVSEPSSSVIATTPKGNTLKIGQVKNCAYRGRDWKGEDVKISVANVRNGAGKTIPLVTLNGNALGILDRDSEMKLKERGLLKEGGLTLSARLENSPPTTARVMVKPETVLYPWQEREREQRDEARRALYREKYEAYTTEILKNPSFKDVSPRDIDIEVAIRAYSDGRDSHEVAGILSQSDRVREWKASVPDPGEYIGLAREYLRQVRSSAEQRLGQTPPSRQQYSDRG